MANLQSLQAQLDTLNAAIKAEKAAAKIMKKIQAKKLTPRTSHKYFDLQAAYMAAVKG